MSFLRTIKNFVIGRSRDIQDQHIFHRISLVAFLAWVGLGADGLSSSCYGPEEAFVALGEHKYLAVFVGLLSVLTVFLISASYSQIIELFPTGGGGYLVASKLLGPNVGMVSGCALLIDYVLTIAISIASGADALFSLLPFDLLAFKFYFAMGGVLLLMLINLRGIRESVVPLTPIFITFVASHFIVILYSLLMHMGQLPHIAESSLTDMKATYSTVGFWGLIFIILRAYSLGAGTFTGIEAVSNGLPILREPKIVTGKKTMQYMAVSLAFTVFGLILAYLFFNLEREEGKTLNAVLLQNITQSWPNPWGHVFVIVTLVSEAMLLFVAAQAGFLDGPRVLANMAIDRWMPSRFSSLSDRLVTQNGVILMGVAALITLWFTSGSVGLLVVLYSINVFITFCLSQAGMVRHWWNERKKEKSWKSKIFINGLGFMMTAFILCTMTVLKFQQGGWVTLFITASLVFLAIRIRNHYKRTFGLLSRLNVLVETIETLEQNSSPIQVKFDPTGKTAAILVNGYNGLGLHTLMGVIRNFSKEFKNFIFIQVGVIDADNFKGSDELERLKSAVHEDLKRYICFMNKNGYYAEGVSSLGIEVVEEAERLMQSVKKRYPDTIFFGGQLVFPKDRFVDHLLHNYTIFSIQKRCYHQGILFMILPIKV